MACVIAYCGLMVFAAGGCEPLAASGGVAAGEASSGSSARGSQRPSDRRGTPWFTAALLRAATWRLQLSSHSNGLRWPARARSFHTRRMRHEHHPQAAPSGTCFRVSASVQRAHSAAQPSSCSTIYIPEHFSFAARRAAARLVRGGDRATRRPVQGRRGRRGRPESRYGRTARSNFLTFNGPRAE